jgi:electron transfer flavoprotein beta subunit
MDIIICIKRVPDVSEIDLEIAPDRKTVLTEDLVFGINEWDNFAIEEAVRIREASGGKVTAVTVGDEADEEVLRRALAMGADEALLLSTGSGRPTDAYTTARILKDEIAERPFDLILTGAVSADIGSGAVGGILAAMLGIPHVALATRIDPVDGALNVRHEVEGGLERIVEVELPALISVQTGINEPRYVSIRGIRKVARVDIPVKEVDYSPGEAWVEVVELTVPQRESTAEIIEGRPEEVVDRLVERIQDRVGV